MDRNYFFDHMDDLSGQQLFEAIKQGIVTLQELKDTEELDKSKCDVILKLLKAHEQEQIKAQADHAKAKDEEQEHNAKSDEKKIILEEIRKDPNSFPLSAINKYLDNKTITSKDLQNAGVPNNVITFILEKKSQPQLELGKSPQSIPDGYTEVYFWGIKSSGKTSALAAILSEAERMGYLEIATGPGYNYMLKLKNIFSNPISLIPGPTPNETTQYLPFVLKKPNEKSSRSVSLIELSGEIFQCFLRKSADKEFETAGQEETFNSLIRFLNSGNRKIHFFLVDYDKKNEPDKDGYKQSDYLNAASTFFNDRDNNFFNRTTDAIYIVLTKSDRTGVEKNGRVDEVKEHLNNANYSAFVNSLRTKCEVNSINAGRILGTPFTLGNVYFQQLCEFDPETSRNIIDILLRRIAPKRQSILDAFNR